MNRPGFATAWLGRLRPDSAGPARLAGMPVSHESVPASQGPISPTIPHKYSKNKNSCFLAGCAGAAVEDGRHCSNVYDVNLCLWQFGRGNPLLDGLTIKETSKRQDAAHKASDNSGKETCEGHKGNCAGSAQVLLRPNLPGRFGVFFPGPLACLPCWLRLKA